MTTPPSDFDLQYSSVAEAPRRRAGLAIWSMVLSFLVCIPVITSLAAIVLSIFFFRLRRRKDVAGEGYATLGFVAGVVGLVLWIGIIGVLYGRYAGAQASANSVAIPFFTAVESGDYATASTYLAPQFPPAGLNKFVGYTEPAFGSFQSMALRGVYLDVNTRRTLYRLHFAATFSRRQANVDIVLLNTPGGYKVYSCRVYP